MEVEDGLGTLPLLRRHLLHGFQDGSPMAVDPDFLTNRIKIEVWLGDRPIQVKDHGFYRHTKIGLFHPTH